MSIFDAIRDFLFGGGDEENNDASGLGLFGEDDDDGITIGGDYDIGATLGDYSDLIDYLVDAPEGEMVNTTFGSLDEALEYVQAAPIGILQIVITETEIEVWRNDDSK